MTIPWFLCLCDEGMDMWERFPLNGIITWQIKLVVGFLKQIPNQLSNQVNVFTCRFVIVFLFRNWRGKEAHEKKMFYMTWRWAKTFCFRSNKTFHIDPNYSLLHPTQFLVWPWPNNRTIPIHTILLTRKQEILPPRLALILAIHPFTISNLFWWT